MAAIQLPDRKQIQRRCKKSEPCGDADGMKVDRHAWWWRLSHEGFHRFEDQRLAKPDAHTCRIGRDISRLRQRDDQRRNREHESDNGSCDTYFEQRRAMLN